MKERTYSPMKKISYVLLAVLFIAVFSHCHAEASEKASEDYVFVLEVEGQITYQAVGEKGETIKKDVRRMELIFPGTILEIEKEASASLTCPGCNVVNLTSQNSPYAVKMSDFRKGRAITSEIARNFQQAIKYYISPETISRFKVETGVRASGEPQRCEGFWPSNNERILPIGENIIFSWDLECNYLSLEIKDRDTKETIFSKITESNRIDVPLKLFQPRKKYEWHLIREGMGKTRDGSFMLLPEEESTGIMKTFYDLPSLLPADKETKFRLQAGYLHSIGLEYNAWQWLELKGVAQQREKTFHASQSTITEADGYACMGYDKSKKQTEEEALVNAKRKAVEYASTYIKSETHVKDFRLEKDLIDAYANATVKIIQELEKGWYKDASSGDCFRTKIKAEVIPDDQMMSKVSKEKGVADDPSAPLHITLWTDKKDYKKGEKIKVYVRGNKPFYARIIYKDAGEGMVQVLPNPYRGDNYFNGGVIYAIPSGSDRFELEISPPLGQEDVIVYASTSPLGELSLQSQGGIYRIKTRAADIGEKTRGVKIIMQEGKKGPSASEFYEDRVVIKTSR